MSKSKTCLDCIYLAIDEWNQRQKEEKFKIPKSLDTVIYGEDSILDSLGIIHFIVSIEENIKEIFNKDIILADEKILNQNESPFQSVQSLNEYISSLITVD